MPTDACPSLPAPHTTATHAVANHGVLAALLLAVAACSTVVPQRAAPLDLPANWAAADTPARVPATSLVQWWQRFDDPLLASLVTQALHANTSVQGAAAALRQARALRDVSAAGLLPTVGGSASAQRSQATTDAGRRVTGSNFRVALDASWELDVFGAQRSALDSGEAGVRATAASLGDVQVSVAAEVALAYITLRSSEARLAIAESNLASQQETLQLTQWRQQAGLVTALDSEQARAGVEQTRAQLPALQTSIEQSRHALAVLTGQAPAALSALLAASAPVPQPVAELALAIPAETLRQRPDVRAAEHQVSAAAARVEQADAERKPSFKLSGSLGLNALTLGSLTSGGAFAAALLAGVSVPLFDGGAGQAQVQAQQAALDQAEAEYKATVLSALKDVEDALVALRGDRERLARLQQAAEASGNAALLARQRYSSGLVDFQTVLETLRSQINTQDGVAAAYADLSADHVRLYKALGGGWQAEGEDAAQAPLDATGPSPRT